MKTSSFNIVAATLLFSRLLAGTEMPAPTMANKPALRQQPLHLSALTPAERQELEKARQQALRDPAVQSTRRITRMALHKAMLQADPSIDTIFANMNAHAPKNVMSIPHQKKNAGLTFQEWLINYPPESTAILTASDRAKLQIAHQKALENPMVQSARKTARIIFYNAMINADPLIGPVLTKAGITTPKSITAPIKNSNIGSEEKILGGNFEEWDRDILTPAVEKMATPAPVK